MCQNLVVSVCGDTRLFKSVRKFSGVRTVVTQGCFIMYQNLVVSNLVTQVYHFVYSISGVCGERSLLSHDCNISVNIFVVTYLILQWF